MHALTHTHVHTKVRMIVERLVRAFCWSAPHGGLPVCVCICVCIRASVGVCVCACIAVVLCEIRTLWRVRLVFTLELVGHRALCMCAVYFALAFMDPMAPMHFQECHTGSHMDVRTCARMHTRMRTRARG